MSDVVIRVKNVQKDYGENRGNFDLNFEIIEGETVGILGENGAGKTTLLRQIMGFIKSDKGEIFIYNFDAYKDSSYVKKYISYIPGEINFPDVKTGNEFLKQYARECKLDDDAIKKADDIIKRMQLDINAYPKRMSKGMKQKTSIVAAFMKDAPIFLMDEPTTGLDPLMRDEFLSLVLENKKKGKTIIMTSNIIEELEKVCDKVIFLTKGRIIDIADCSLINNRDFRIYKIEFTNKRDFRNFLNEGFNVKRIQEQYNQVTIEIKKDEFDRLFKVLSNYKLKFMSEVIYNLQSYFDEKRKTEEK